MTTEKVLKEAQTICNGSGGLLRSKCLKELRIEAISKGIDWDSLKSRVDGISSNTHYREVERKDFSNYCDED
jgi:hypothetical protein